MDLKFHAYLIWMNQEHTQDYMCGLYNLKNKGSNLPLSVIYRQCDPGVSPFFHLEK